MQTKDGLYYYAINKFGLYKLVECSQNSNALTWIMIKSKNGHIDVYNDERIEFTAADDNSAILIYELGDNKI